MPPQVADTGIPLRPRLCRLSRDYAAKRQRLQSRTGWPSGPPKRPIRPTRSRKFERQRAWRLVVRSRGIAKRNLFLIHRIFGKRTNARRRKGRRARGGLIACRGHTWQAPSKGGCGHRLLGEVRVAIAQWAGLLNRYHEYSRIRCGIIRVRRTASRLSESFSARPGNGPDLAEGPFPEREAANACP